MVILPTTVTTPTTAEAAKNSVIVLNVALLGVCHHTLR
jgi:hypothetical protein